MSREGLVARGALSYRNFGLRFVSVGACPAGEGVTNAGRVIERESSRFDVIFGRVGSRTFIQFVRDGVGNRRPVSREGLVARGALGNRYFGLRFVSVGACPAGEGVANAGRVIERESLGRHRVLRRVCRFYLTLCEVVSDGVVHDIPFGKEADETFVGFGSGYLCAIGINDLAVSGRCPAGKSITATRERISGQIVAILNLLYVHRALAAVGIEGDVLVIERIPGIAFIFKSTPLGTRILRVHIPIAFIRRVIYQKVQQKRPCFGLGIATVAVVKIEGAGQRSCTRLGTPGIGRTNGRIREEEIASGVVGEVDREVHRCSFQLLHVITGIQRYILRIRVRISMYHIIPRETHAGVRRHHFAAVVGGHDAITGIYATFAARLKTNTIIIIVPLKGMGTGFQPSVPSSVIQIVECHTPHIGGVFAVCIADSVIRPRTFGLGAFHLRRSVVDICPCGWRYR